MNLSIVFILFCFGFFIFLACSFFLSSFHFRPFWKYIFFNFFEFMKSVRFSKTSQFVLVKVIVNIVLLLLIYFIMNCFEVSDTFPKGRGNKNFVIFVTKSSLIGLFLYSIFIENSNFLANQTGFGLVRTCYCEDGFYQEHVWSWNKTEAVWWWALC